MALREGLTTPLLQGTVPTHELYARALSAAYHLHLRIIDPDFALQNELFAWEKLNRDGKIAQGVQQRCHAVAGADWFVEPASDDPQDKLLAAVVSDALDRIEDFREARYELATAIFRGRAYQFIEGTRRFERLGGVDPQEWWIPLRLRDVDKRRFQFVPRVERLAAAVPGTERIELEEQLWSVARERWERVERPELFIRLIYRDEEGRLGYGRGLMESIYFLWWTKQQILKEGLQGLERWARGFLIAKVSSKQGSVGRSTDDVQDKFLKTLEAMQARHVMAVDKDDDVQMISGPGEGQRIIFDFLRYIDDCLMGTIMGSVLPFGGGDSGGSLARADVESETSEQVLQFDRGKLSEAITRSVVRLFLHLNRPALTAAGLIGARCPRFQVIQGKRKKPDVQAQVIATLLGAGLKLREDEAYAEVGFTPPTAGDRVVETRPPTPTFPPPLGLGGLEGFNAAAGRPGGAAPAPAG